MTGLPAYFPRTAHDLMAWRRNTRSHTLNDEMDMLLNELIVGSEDFALLCSAYTDNDAVYGRLELDDFEATKQAWDYAKSEDGRGRYPLVAELDKRQFGKALRALRVAKRRSGMSRDDMKARAERAGGAAA